MNTCGSPARPDLTWVTALTAHLTLWLAVADGGADLLTALDGWLAAGGGGARGFLHVLHLHLLVMNPEIRRSEVFLTALPLTCAVSRTLPEHTHTQMMMCVYTLEWEWKWCFSLWYSVITPLWQQTFVYWPVTLSVSLFPSVLLSSRWKKHRSAILTKNTHMNASVITENHGKKMGIKYGRVYFGTECLCVFCECLELMSSVWNAHTHAHT